MKYIFFFVFFFIFVVLVVSYFNITRVVVKKHEVYEPQIIKQEEKTTILKLLATTKAENIFPARELYLKMDLNYIPKIKILYRTIIKDLDKYKVFGIEQILELNKIKYSIIKTTNNLQLFINFDKKSQAIKVQQMFEDYNFDVKLKEVKIVEKIKG